MMDVREFESMLLEANDAFKKALIAEKGNIGSAMAVAKRALRLCTNDFEERTVVENLKQVLEETVVELAGEGA